MAKSSKRKPKKPTISTPQKSEKKQVRKHVQESLPTKWKAIIGGILAILAMAIYAPSYDFDFVYDDDAVVKDNKYVKEGLGGLGKIWTTTYFKGYDENINARAFRPVPLTTLAIEYEIGGLNSTVNHISNILFYGLTSFFLFFFLSKLLREHHPIFPILATLFFVLHPIHIEVVANIKSRDSMYGFMNLMIAFWLLLKYVDHRKITQLASMLLFYSIALFSKEEVVTSVAVIPVMLYCFREFSIGKSLRYTMPFISLSLIFLAIRSEVILGNSIGVGILLMGPLLLALSIRGIFAKSFRGMFEVPAFLLITTMFVLLTNTIKGFSAGVDLTYLDNSLLAAKGASERIASNLIVLGHYLLKTIWPSPLISDYSYSTIPLSSWDDWKVYLSLVANLGLFSLSVFGLIKRKAWSFGLFWYFASVSIFTSIITTNVSAYNDRFLFTPVLGICFTVAWILTSLSSNKAISGANTFVNKNIPVLSIAVLISIACIYKVESHLPVWKDRYVLFEHDAELTPTNARTRKNHGGSLARKALSFQNKDEDKMQEHARNAITELEAALKIYPYMPTGHIHKGNMHILLQEYGPATASFSEALRQAPNNYFAKSSLAIAYYHQGKYRESLNTLNSIPAHLRRPSDEQMIQRCQSKL